MLNFRPHKRLIGWDMAMWSVRASVTFSVLHIRIKYQVVQSVTKLLNILVVKISIKDNSNCVSYKNILVSCSRLC